MSETNVSNEQLELWLDDRLAELERAEPNTYTGCVARQSVSIGAELLGRRRYLWASCQAFTWAPIESDEK